MLIFYNWLKEKYKLDVEDILSYDKYNKYVEEYCEYEKNFPLTKTFEESISFLKGHPSFQNKFDKCIYMLGEDKKGEVVLEVDMYVLDEKTNQYYRAHVIDYDVYGFNYENAIIKLAHKVETNYRED